MKKVLLHVLNRKKINEHRDMYFQLITSFNGKKLTDAAEYLIKEHAYDRYDHNEFSNESNDYNICENMFFKYQHIDESSVKFTHPSLSVGDIVEITYGGVGSKYYVVAGTGFEELFK